MQIRAAVSPLCKYERPKGALVTAEVVILNREAVAIAADSAVTVAGRGPKIYNSANKLFPLSIIEPVAVMMYGAETFGPIPWETVVKEYRKARGTKTFGTVAAYATDFTDHLAGLTQYVSRNEQLERVALTARWELEMIRDAIEEEILAASAGGTELDDSAITELILHEINAAIKHLAQGTFVEGLSAAIVGREIGSAAKDWPDFVAASFRGLPIDARVVRRARVLIRTSLRLADRSPGSGGVVVAGFGESQIFPALSHFFFDGVVANRLRSRPGGHVRIDGNQSASIYPFAQEDMVATFMDGVHPGYRLALDGFVDQTVDLLIDHFSDLVVDSLSTEAYSRLRSEMQAARAGITGHFRDQLDEFLERHNSGPIMSVVEMLPKEELAEMAEALVNLTSLKRRVMPGAETVGGPIDVAVISKGDGLVWIKRKHYFDPKLNHRYFDRDRQLRGSGTLEGTS